MPGWADFNGGDVYYGFPDLEGKGVKFAHDTHGARVDPDTQSRTYQRRSTRPRSSPSATVASPALRGAPLIGSRGLPI